MPYEMFWTMQLVHLTCRKDRVQSPTRKEGWDLFQWTSDDSSRFTLIIQNEEWWLGCGIETWREVHSIFHMDQLEQVYEARFLVCLRKNRLWHDILYWLDLLEVYIKHRTTYTKWRRKMILHFRGSGYRRYMSSTWYDMMDNFLMDRDFTKSKVGSNLQGWMQKTRICWWPDKMNSWKMLCLGYNTQTRKQ